VPKTGRGFCQGGGLPVRCPEGLVMVTGGREIDIGERIIAERKNILTLQVEVYLIIG